MLRRTQGESIPDLTGDFIDDGRLLILGLLGQGAFSKVFRAVDVKSSPEKPCYYAVKCLWRADVNSKNAGYRIRELSLHKLVSSHPNIVSIHKVISDDYFIYAIMELAQTCLYEVVASKNNPFVDNDALTKETFVKILDAIAYCHARGIYHRDLKPENIMCDKNGTSPLVADFGLSTTSTSSRQFGCGTRRYYSPECLDYGRYKHQYKHAPNDVWALGIILINMVACRHPWKAASAEDECYSYYTTHRNFLYNVFPISHEARDLFNLIFDPNPSTRIKLPELRKRVLELGTFFRMPKPPRGSISTMTTDYNTSSSGPESYITPLSTNPVHVIAPADYPPYAANTRLLEFSDRRPSWEQAGRARISETPLSANAPVGNPDLVDGTAPANRGPVSPGQKKRLGLIKLFPFKMFQKLALKS